MLFREELSQTSFSGKYRELMGLGNGSVGKGLAKNMKT